MRSAITLIIALITISCKDPDMGEVRFNVTNKGSQPIPKIKVVAYSAPNGKPIYIDSTVTNLLQTSQTVNLAIPHKNLTSEGAFEIRVESTLVGEKKKRFGFFDQRNRTSEYNITIIDTSIVVK